MLNTIVAVVLLVVIIIWLITSLRAYLHKLKYKISFRESMDLTALPVITFTNNGKKLNFLLDTGSNFSYINTSILEGLDYQMSGNQSEMIGVEGNTVTNDTGVMNIYYKDKSFELQFNSNNMDSAFTTVKNTSGVQLHGILGSLFFQRYKYVLDFDSLIAYIK